MTTDDLRAKLERAIAHGFGPIELIDTSDSMFPTTLLGLVGDPGRNGIGFAQIHHGLDEDNDAWGALFVDALNSLPTLLDQAARVEALEGALRAAVGAIDKADHDCPIRTRQIEICPKCRSTPNESCRMNDRAVFALEKIVRDLLSSPASTSPSIGGGLP